MILPARTTRPPKAWPIAWWPRQTPMMGIFVWNCPDHVAGDPRLLRREQGPGERKIASGLHRLDLLQGDLVVPADDHLLPSWPRYWTRL